MSWLFLPSKQMAVFWLIARSWYEHLSLGHWLLKSPCLGDFQQELQSWSSITSSQGKQSHNTKRSPRAPAPCGGLTITYPAAPGLKSQPEAQRVSCANFPLPEKVSASSHLSLRPHCTPLIMQRHSWWPRDPAMVCLIFFETYTSYEHCVSLRGPFLGTRRCPSWNLWYQNKQGTWVCWIPQFPL